MKIKLIVFTLALCIIPGLCFAGDVVVIVNNSVPETTLSKKDVGNIYLGKKTSWSDSSKIKFIVLSGGNTFISLF